MSHDSCINYLSIMDLNHCSLKSELIITNNKKTVLFFRFTDSKTNKVAYMDLLKYLNYTIDPTLGSQGVSKVILLKMIEFHV